LKFCPVCDVRIASESARICLHKALLHSRLLEINEAFAAMPLVSSKILANLLSRRWEGNP